MTTKLDSIYLNKHEDKPPQTFAMPNGLLAEDIGAWTYYRMRGHEHDGETLEVCRVSWPDFADLGSPIGTYGVVGYVSAEDAIQTLLENSLGVDHRRSIFIGMRVSGT
jgi:hypothetical protein